MKCEQVRFLCSSLTTDEFPSIKSSRNGPLPEIALVGRSNVGKSSLINALFLGKAVAKISATPGKTQRINFFLVDESALLVDLPGYGYAKAPRSNIKEWGQAIDTYLNNRDTLRLLLLLLDIRRLPSEEDLQIANWAVLKKIPLLIVFTKSDKLSKAQGEIQIRSNLTHLPKNIYVTTFSNKEKEGRKHIIQKINEALS